MDISVFPRWSPYRRHGLRGLSTVEERVDADADATPVIAGKPKPTSTSKLKTWETTVERIESWPEEARPLKKHTWLSYLYGLGDIVLVLLPLYFICK